MLEVGQLHNPETHLIPLAIDAAISEKSTLHVFGDDYKTPDGSAIRDYIHVVDLADAHVKAVSRLLTDSAGASNIETINLGTGIGYSVLEVIKAFEAVSGNPLNYEITKRREGDVAELYASTALAKKLLNWEAKLGLESMIQSSWDWEQNLRND